VRSLVRPLERGLRFREPTFRVHINLSLTGPF